MTWRRLWCVAPGCGWAHYRVQRRADGTVLADRQVARGRCPRCRQYGLRVYPPGRRMRGEQPLPGMPRAADAKLRRVNGKRLQARRRAERAGQVG